MNALTYKTDAIETKEKVDAGYTRTTGALLYKAREMRFAANGLVSIEIGNGTVVSGAFSAINLANGPYFVKTEIDPTGGTKRR